MDCRFLCQRMLSAKSIHSSRLGFLLMWFMISSQILETSVFLRTFRSQPSGELQFYFQKLALVLTFEITFLSCLLHLHHFDSMDLLLCCTLLGVQKERNPYIFYDALLMPCKFRWCTGLRLPGLKPLQEVYSRRVIEDDGERQLVEVDQAAIWRFLCFSGTFSVCVLVDQDRRTHTVSTAVKSWPELSLHNNEPVSSGFWKGLGFRVPALYHGQFLNMLLFTVSCLAPHLQIHMYVHCTGAFASCSMYACRQLYVKDFLVFQVKFWLAKKGFMKQFEGSWKIQPFYIDAEGGPAPEDNANWVASIVFLQQVYKLLSPTTETSGIFDDAPTVYLWWWSNSISLMVIMGFSIQVLQPALVPPPLIKGYVRGITAKATEVLTLNLQAEGRRWRQGTAEDGNTNSHSPPY